MHKLDFLKVNDFNANFMRHYSKIQFVHTYRISNFCFV